MKPKAGHIWSYYGECEYIISVVEDNVEFILDYYIDEDNIEFYTRSPNNFYTDVFSI